MRQLTLIWSALVISLILTAPAFAQGVAVADPSDLSLVALGLMGIYLGHKGSRKLRE
jgi:hypothetical protein